MNQILRFYTPHTDVSAPRATVVGRVTEGGKTIELTAALCSVKDNFSRKKGRQIAEGRLNKGRILMVVEVQEEKSLVKQFVENAKSLEKDVISSPEIIEDLYYHETE